MAILFKPTGKLNITASATDLPEQADGSSVVSYSMQRCKNVSLDYDGKTPTRPGSTDAFNLATSIASFIVEQAGVIYSFAGANIFRGETSIASGLTDAEWSAVKYNQYNDTQQQIFATNGTNRKRIAGSSVYDWGIEPPTVAPTLASGGDTGLTGSFNAKYTYARIIGGTVISESNPSPAASADQSLTDDELRVTWTASTDSQVTHVRLYRTTASGSAASNYFHDQDVAIGTVTVDTSTADASLGSVVATNHDRPPLGTVVAGPFYNGVVFMAVGHLLYWCLAKQPEYFPALNYIEVGSPQFPIKAIVSLDGNVYCVTQERIWLIQGTVINTFSPLPVESLAGAPNQFGAVAVKGYGIFHIAPDGIYLFSGKDQKFTGTSIDPLFRGEDVNGMHAIHPGGGGSDETGRWLFLFENNLIFHYRDGKVFSFDLDSGKVEYHVYDTKLSAPCHDRKEARLLVGTSAQTVRELFDRDVNTDAGTAFDWEVESKDFGLQTRPNFPRWAKYDIDGTATAKIYLGGELHQTHEVTGSRSVVRRLIKTGNNERMSVRISGSTSNGAATVYAAELE